MGTWNVNTASSDPSFFDGAVGIGTVSPSAPFAIKKDPAEGYPWIGQMLIEPASDDYEAAITLRTTKTENHRIWSIIAGRGIVPDTNFRIYDGNECVDRLDIDGLGRIGVGTISPSQRLEVVGNALLKGDDGWDGAGDEATLYLGDTNHYIKAVHSSGVRIGTYYNPDLITLKQSAVVGSGAVGIGSTNPPSKLHVEGSVGVKVSPQNTDYTAADEAVIIVSGSHTVTLPSASDANGRMYYIKKGMSTSNVVVTAVYGQLIDGAQYKTLPPSGNYSAIRVVSDGTQWWILDLMA